MLTTYTVISQNTNTGKIVETATYDNLEYARIHYDNLSQWDSNRIIRKQGDTITVVEEI